MNQLLSGHIPPDCTGLSPEQRKAVADYRLAYWFAEKDAVWTDKRNCKFVFQWPANFGGQTMDIKSHDKKICECKIYDDGNRIIIRTTNWLDEGVADRESGIIRWKDGTAWIRNPLSGTWLEGGKEIVRVEDSARFLDVSVGERKYTGIRLDDRDTWYRVSGAA